MSEPTDVYLVLEDQQCDHCRGDLVCGTYATEKAAEDEVRRLGGDPDNPKKTFKPYHVEMHPVQE